MRNVSVWSNHIVVAEAILFVLLAGPVAEQMPETDPAIATAIKQDLESVAGPGSVDVDRASGKLFSIRIAVPTLSSDFCNPIYDRELKLFRLFPELNFDFYLRLRNTEESKR